jgi:hypothetical protein
MRFSWKISGAVEDKVSPSTGLVCDRLYSGALFDFSPERERSIK